MNIKIRLSDSVRISNNETRKTKSEKRKSNQLHLAEHKTGWAKPWQNAPYAICEQHWHRSVCASAQSDQTSFVSCRDNMRHIMRKPVLCCMRTTMRRPACAFAQSDQRLCCSLPRKYDPYNCFTGHFRTLSGFRSCADRFEPFLVRAYRRRQVFSWRGFTCYAHNLKNSFILITFIEQLYLSRSMTKPTKWPVRPAKTQISLPNCIVWSESSLCAQWVAMDPNVPRTAKTLIRLGGCLGWSESSLGAHAILLVLSCRGSFLLRWWKYAAVDVLLTAVLIYNSSRLWILLK